MMTKNALYNAYNAHTQYLEKQQKKTENRIECAENARKYYMKQQKAQDAQFSFFCRTHKTLCSNFCCCCC